MNTIEAINKLQGMSRQLVAEARECGGTYEEIKLSVNSGVWVQSDAPRGDGHWWIAGYYNREVTPPIFDVPEGSDDVYVSPRQALTALKIRLGG